MSSSFAEAQDAFFADYFRLYPIHATEAGNHEHDHEWPDLTDAGRAERLSWLADARAKLDALDGLTRDEEIDRRVLAAQVDALRFDEEELDELSWSPIVYSYLVGGGLFGLLSREFAPLADRLTSAAGRMEGIPSVLAAARHNLTSGRGRPVSRFHAEKAIATMPGVGDLCGTAVEMANASGVTDRLRARVHTTAEAAAAAVDAFTEWLSEVLLPTVDGDFRLGRDLYERKFHHMLKATITPDELERRAANAYAEVRTEMHRLARELWPTWVGGEAMPSDDDVLTRRVLDAIAADHPRADDLLDYCRAENERIEAFIRERDLVGLAEEPLKIIWTPPFLRAFGGAMLIPPGPLDSGLDSFFAITPPPDDWTDEQVESMLRENNARQLRLLTIHEAVPGHYLQLAWSNRCDSLPRSVFGSGVFAEGWAVYVTQVMMDVGYGSDDPALMLVHWKFFLRAITNTLMDIRIHAGSMTEEEAMTLMVEGGFQERSEASEKWSRARLSSTQLCEYFLGFTEMTELEQEERRRRRDDFAWRPFLESVLSHGTPPMPVIRDILYGD
ncbi:MAG TPA: DUF885 domain-containing protein [Candidatus Limnocylindria bacterium]|nr:DUF885 domain-containing protein [Candidatus Limnocylindria bacterium]